MANTPFVPPPGFRSDDTKFLATGSWRGGSLIRFWEGQWQVRGGWERLSLTKLNGVCRACFAWTDGLPNVSQTNIAFGTHQTLELWQAGTQVDITPTLNPAPVAMGVDPIAITNGSATVTVTMTAHGLVVNDRFRLSALTNAGNINPNGTWIVASVPDANHVTFTAPFPATSTVATAGGSGGTIQKLVTGNFIPGQIDGTGGAGYGTGAYGVGPYGVPSTVDYFPLTWSFGAFGSWLLANPRNQGIYVWKNDVTQKAVALANAPTQVTYMLTLPQRQVMALGCNQEVGNYFNPRAIRWSDIEDPTVWTTLSSNNAGEYILEGGGRIVAGRVVGDYVFVWTDVALYLGRFIGAPDQTWAFEKLGDNCGLIGPGAAAVVDQRAVWISPDHQFWQCGLGGVPSIVDCPIWSEFKDNLALGQNDKIVASTISTYREVFWGYADARDGLEVSRQITLGANGWYNGRLARTAVCDSDPTEFPVMVDFAGNIYWHEKGASADGANLTGFIESNDVYLGDADGGLLVNGCWPDIKDQIGVMKLTIFTRENPQAVERTHGPWALSPGQGRRSFRLSGRIARVRFDFDSAPAYARGGKFEFDIAAVGGR